MTVEAALVLPLFLFFFLNLGSVMEIMRLHGRIETAIWEIGRETALYGTVLNLKGSLNAEETARFGAGETVHLGAGEAVCFGVGETVHLGAGETVRFGTGESGITAGSASESGKDSWLAEIGDLVLSYTYVKGRIREYLGEDYLNDAPIRGGADGLQFIGSDLIGAGDILDIVVTYPIEPLWRIAAFRTFLMENRYYGRLWTGYDVSQASGAIYYLAEHAEVYHADRDCSYLRLSVQQIKRGELGSAVNAEGRKYRACEKCVQKRIPEECWIAKEGECFHARRDCSGLKRVYRVVTWEEAKKYRPCSRCAGGGQ